MHSLLAMSLIFGGLLLLLSKMSALRLRQMAARATKIWVDHRRRSPRDYNSPAGFRLLQSVIKAEVEADDDWWVIAAGISFVISGGILVSFREEQSVFHHGMLAECLGVSVVVGLSLHRS